MKRFLTLTLLLAAMLAVAACGEADTGQSERSTPTEPQRTQVEPTQQDAPEETTQGGVPADDEASESTRRTTREADESSGFSVTTVEGEEVTLGGQGDVTALFFMAGW